MVVKKAKDLLGLSTQRGDRKNRQSRVAHTFARLHFLPSAPRRGIVYSTKVLNSTTQNHPGGPVGYIGEGLQNQKAGTLQIITRLSLSTRNSDGLTPRIVTGSFSPSRQHTTRDKRTSSAPGTGCSNDSLPTHTFFQ